jgi:hypothetical protein
LSTDLIIALQEPLTVITASAMLSVESFALANDPTIFPEQLQFVQPWQVKRQFFNLMVVLRYYGKI